MQKALRIVLIIAAVGLGVYLSKDFIIKSAVASAAEQVLGAKVHIGSMKVGLLQPHIHLRDVEIFNPAGFPKGRMVFIIEVSVDYDLKAILAKNLHLPRVVVRLKELVVVRNSQGVLNIDQLKVSKQSSTSKPMPMKLDEVTLDLGQVIVKDYSRTPNQVLGYDIGVHNKVFKNITSAEQFAALVLVHAITPTAINNAAIYAVASMAQVAFLPAGVAGLLMSNSPVSQTFKSPAPKVFEALLGYLKKNGTIISINKTEGIIKAEIDGVSVGVVVFQEEQTRVKITSRKMMLPKPEVSRGILYNIAEIIQ